MDESLSQALVFLINLVVEFPNKFKPCEKIFIGYDSACMLKNYCDNQAKRYPNSRIIGTIADLRKVHDRLHVKNHHPDCQNGELNPDKHEILKGVNTESAEQYFAHLLKFVTLFKNTSSTRAPIWLMVIQHQWNIRKEARLNNSAPSKKMVCDLPLLKFVKAFKTKVKCISEKTKKQLLSMETEVRLKLLEPWAS